MSNNPIEIFYCWQALVTALMVYMLTQVVKAALPLVYTPKTAKGKMVFKRVILPAVPPILGFLGAAFMPIRPEPLLAYVAANAIPAMQAKLIYGAWGAAVGQFADYVYSKVSKFVGDFKPQEPTA